MEQLGKRIYDKKVRPIGIMQFGEGNFLRAFVEWIVQDLNDKGAIDSDIVVVQPMPMGRVADLAKQDGLYTLRLEGIQNGNKVQESRIIDVIGDCLNPFTEYEKFLAYAESEQLKLVISNTTEAGIAFDPTDTDFTVCPKSYPGKLLALLKRRYEYFGGDPEKGLCIIPCELIDNNGDELKRVLLELARHNALEAGLIDWIEHACHYTSTLVDRIVPGYPKNEIPAIQAETGYIDTSVVKGEIFHLWVLKNEPTIRQLFPADATGLNVIFADSIKPYKERKVKILNGSHTALVPVAYLAGFDTVGESVSDPTLNRYLRDFIFGEVNPTIDLPQDQMEAFANSVIERFLNPFIRHELMSIALNSTTKFTTRLLPTLKDYIERTGEVPAHLLFSLAALIAFHEGKRGDQPIALNDNPEYLARWKAVWEKSDLNEIVRTVLGWSDIWGVDMNALHPALTATVAADLTAIRSLGMKEAVERFVHA